MKNLLLFLVVSISIFPKSSLAGDEVINQLRFYYGQRNIDPKDANTALTAAGFDEIKKLDHYGIEAARVLLPYVNLGLRLDIALSQAKATDTSISNTRASLGQVSLLPIIAIPFINNDTLKLEAFTGFGLSNTTYTVKTATEDGNLQRGLSGPTGIAGLSLAIGRKYVFLKIEGGYHYSKADNLAKTGTVTNMIDTIDLSGSYFNIGILVDGLKLGKM